MPAKSLILCVHAHQPVGNFDWVFEEAYEKCYRPFFDVLCEHPQIVMNVHFSGSLLDWLEQKKPDFLLRLKKMAERGQVEFLGGGYYEPIYGLIPKRDLVGQIHMMSEKVKALFGVLPRGAWLTERVWDTHLVKTLKESRIEYTVLDDLHFENIGKRPPVTGYYQAKDGKARLDLFASIKSLRYLMPFRRPEETLAFIASQTAAPEEVFVFADDVEKFGMWPGTHEWVYRQGWLENFLSLLEKDPAVKLYTFSKFRNTYAPRGFEEIPHASYSEMMEWSGGHFYNFFKKYPEAEYMRDRMTQVSARVNAFYSKNGSRQKWDLARKALYRAQCNCSYWHGVFGGLYLHHLRSAVFENLIRAETLLNEMAVKSESKSASIFKDPLVSGERWCVRARELTSFFNPRYGASLEELDYLPKSANLTCNLQRHREPYHQSVLEKAGKAKPILESPAGKSLSIHEILGSKEEGLERHLFYDQTRRLSFMDHFFEERITAESFAKSLYTEAGDFLGSRYSARAVKGKPKESLLFTRKGFVRVQDKKFALTLRKEIFPSGKSALKVNYSFKNETQKMVSFIWGAEFNFSIGEAEARAGLEKRGLKEWVFYDGWREVYIRLKSDSAMDFLAAPVETVSESESGMEKTYQELGVLLQKKIELLPKETLCLSLELEVFMKDTVKNHAD